MSELINGRIENDAIENYKKLKRAMKDLYLITEKDIADDINDRITNVMKDYKSQIIISNNKLDRENLRRKEAEKVIDFYAEGNSHYDSKYEWDIENHCKTMGTATLPSGETAREYKDKYKDQK